MKKDFMKNVFLILIAGASAVFITIGAKAEVKANSLFASHAVLQRNADVPVWGTAENGETITVEFAGQKLTAMVENGKWMLKLKPLKAGGPFTMVIKGTKNTLTFDDILVGEVWVCSGQSNMALKMSASIADGEREMTNANYPEIRQFGVPQNATDQPVADVKGTWKLCATENIKSFTAVGYFFARDLYQQLHVPIGIILSAVGGTPAENWTSRTALAGSTPEMKNIVSRYDNAVETYPARLAKYIAEEPALLEKYRTDSALAKQENKPLPRKPAPPQENTKSGAAGGLYNAMIKPLQPYAIKGTIWYQGEANSSRGKEYQTLFPLMITDWRNAWGQGEFPFLFVQIAPYKGMSPEIREAQLLTWQKTPNTAMAVTTDCGNAEDIHPGLKQPVGARLALAARALAYKEKIEYEGPVYDAIKVENGKAILTFTHAKKLVAKDGELKGFMIAGADKKFVEAKAEIKKDKLIVYSDLVTAPVAVRYGWANVPDVNLYNEADLPATPFRTDID